MCTKGKMEFQHDKLLMSMALEHGLKFTRIKFPIGIESIKWKIEIEMIKSVCIRKMM